MDKKYLLFLFVLIFSCFACYRLCERLKRVQTSTILSRSSLAIGKTFNKKQWQAGYVPEIEIKKIFPGTKMKNQHVIDGWGNPLRIEIEENGKQFVITVRSAGKDGIFDTEDNRDLYRWIVLDKD